MMSDIEEESEAMEWHGADALHDVADGFNGKWRILFKIPFTRIEVAIFVGAKGSK